MSEAIEVTFGFERRQFRRALMAFWFSAVPRPSISYRIIFWLIVWLAVLVFAMVVAKYKVPAAYAWGIAVVAIGLWFLALQRVRMARFYRVLAEHWDRTGEMTAAFDAAGVKMTAEGTRMEFAWSAVDDVVRMRGGTVFRIGMAMISIPDARLPAGLKPAEFRARLDTWRNA